MTAVATPFGSAAGKYKFLGDAKLVNCFAEIREDNGKAKYVIVPSDGTSLFSSVTDTPSRGSLYLDDLGTGRSVHSGRTYSINSSGTATSIGVVPGIDKVRIARNQNTAPQIAYHAAVGIYVEQSGAIAKLQDDDLPSDVVDITVADGYLIALIEDGRFIWSALNDMLSIDGLDFATAEQSADGGVACWWHGGMLFIFGRETTEVFRNTGNIDSLWEPMPTAIPRGCGGRWSIAEIDNAITFLGNDGIYYRLNGLQPERISNHEVERLVQLETDRSVIEAQSWSRAGHAFVELKGLSWSKVYDANTQQWHDRESYGQDTWRHNNAFQAWGKVIFGDRMTGNLYSSDETVYTEASGTQVMRIKFPTMNTFPNGAIVDAVHLDWVTGQGVTSPTALGYDPLLMLKVSKDGGNSFAYERELKTGMRGAYGRVTTRRLGRVGPQGMVMELACSDPVGRALAQVDAQVRLLKR